MKDVHDDIYLMMMTKPKCVFFGARKLFWMFGLHTAIKLENPARFDAYILKSKPMVKSIGMATTKGTSVKPQRKG